MKETAIQIDIFKDKLQDLFKNSMDMFDPPEFFHLPKSDKDCDDKKEEDCHDQKI